MKHKWMIWITPLLCLALLCGCASGGQAPAATPEAPVSTATPAPTATPETTPEPPSTVPDPPPAPEKNGMYELLCGLMDDYHAGTAGSSLRAAWYAASIVDWAAKNAGFPVQAGAMAWDRPMENEYGETLKAKLDTVYAVALELTVSDKGILADCGYTEPWDYSSRQVKGAFEALYAPLELPAPILTLVWFPDEEAQYLLTAAVEAGDISPAGLTRAMTGLLLQDGAAVLSVEEGEPLRVDMNAAFADQIRQYGTSGELLTMGGLVNTMLDAFGAQSVLLTVEGKPLETGHNIYDQPMKYFEETW